jgi:DNA-binding Lrp family transcriptional regulator
MEQSLNQDDRRLVASLIENARPNISAISKVTGLSPTSIRNRLKRLMSREQLVFKPLFSAALLGNNAALLRIKGGRREVLLRIMLNCNRVLGVMVVNDNELIAMVYGRDKKEIASLVSVIKYLSGEIDEIEIHYGKLPNDYMIPLRNNSPNCYSYLNHTDIYTFCGNCLPSLRRR